MVNSSIARRRIVSRTIVLLCSAVPALAQTPEELSAAAILRALDRDGDGKLTRFEAAEAAMRLVDEACADASGVATLEGVIDHLETQQRERSEEALEIIESLDEDDSGALEVNEIPEEFAPLRSHADINDDGAVTVHELLDSGVLDSARPMIEAEFLGLLDDLDFDGDGRIELATLPPAMDADERASLTEFDLDDDGVITREELLQRVDVEYAGARFDIRGEVAHMNGVIGPTTPGRVLELLVEHPGVRTIELVNVPGSLDDESNLRAARMLHRAGLRTRVAKDGEIASGGVDFFLAGHDRVVGPGGRLGVHSWAGGGGETGATLPRDAEEHRMFLDFYRDIGIEADFYWYTLEAAPAEDVHWMTAEEIERYHVAK